MRNRLLAAGLVIALLALAARADDIDDKLGAAAVKGGQSDKAASVPAKPAAVDNRDKSEGKLRSERAHANRHQADKLHKRGDVKHKKVGQPKPVFQKP